MTPLGETPGLTVEEVKELAQIIHDTEGWEGRDWADHKSGER